MPRSAFPGSHPDMHRYGLGDVSLYITVISPKGRPLRRFRRLSRYYVADGFMIAEEGATRKETQPTVGRAVLSSCQRDTLDKLSLLLSAITHNA